MHEDRFAFNRGAIRPMDCLREGWQLIKDEYWFFLGITFVGVMVAQLAPFGVLMGPAMCGIHICLLRKANGQLVKFEMLFQGFNYFGQSFLATIVMMAPILVCVLIYYILAFGGMIGVAVMVEQKGGRPPDQSVGLLLLGWVLVVTLVFIAVMLLLQGLFLFVFPLIVDRELSGWEAVTTSFRAAFANLGGVLAIIFLEFLLGLAGVLACYVGVIFVLPISYAMTAVAYRQVFPIIDPYEDYEMDPEPPAPIVVSKDTGVQSREPRSSGVQAKPPEEPGPAPA